MLSSDVFVDSGSVSSDGVPDAFTAGGVPQASASKRPALLSPATLPTVDVGVFQLGDAWVFASPEEGVTTLFCFSDDGVPDADPT